MTLLIALGLAGVLIQSPAAAPAAALSGRIVEEGSLTPVAGAHVTLFPVLSDRTPSPGHNGPATTITDHSGAYRFDAVDAGAYRIVVQKPGFAMPDALGVPELHLAAGERRDDVEVTLQKGAVIAGRVVDEAGEPVVDARVMAMQKSRRRSGAAPMRADALMPAGPGAQTNDLGEFRLFGLPPGEYYVHAMSRPEIGEPSAPRTTTMVPTYFPSTSDVLAAQPIAVSAGQTSGDVVIRMITASAFEVSGVVVDEAGRPVENAMVRLVMDDSTPLAMFMIGSLSHSRSDASGKFSVGNITSGTYTLLAVPPVVLPGPAGRRGAQGGANGGFISAMAFSSGAGAAAGGGVMTETRDGTTIQYRDDTATRMPITVDQANLSGLQVVVRPPAR